MIDLVPGYGVTLTQRQLDEVLGCSGTLPTKLVRNLIYVFFIREQLANSSCYGSRNITALDKEILSACFSE